MRYRGCRSFPGGAAGLARAPGWREPPPKEHRQRKRLIAKKNVPRRASYIRGGGIVTSREPDRAARERDPAPQRHLYQYLLPEERTDAHLPSTAERGCQPPSEPVRAGRRPRAVLPRPPPPGRAARAGPRLSPEWHPHRRHGPPREPRRRR